MRKSTKTLVAVGTVAVAVVVANEVFKKHQEETKKNEARKTRAFNEFLNDGRERCYDKVKQLSNMAESKIITDIEQSLADLDDTFDEFFEKFVVNDDIDGADYYVCIEAQHYNVIEFKLDAVFEIFSDSSSYSNDDRNDALSDVLDNINSIG